MSRVNLGRLFIEPQPARPLLPGRGESASPRPHFIRNELTDLFDRHPRASSTQAERIRANTTFSDKSNLHAASYFDLAPVWRTPDSSADLIPIETTSDANAYASVSTPTT